MMPRVHGAGALLGLVGSLVKGFGRWIWPLKVGSLSGGTVGRTETWVTPEVAAA